MAERGNLTLRFFDRWLGIPLVFALGLLRRKRKPPTHVDSIGLVLFAAIGDSLIASTLIEDLKRRYPQAKIVGFLSEANRAFAEIVDGFDETVMVPVSRPWAAVRAIRQRPVDILLDIGQWARINAALSALAKTKFTVGLSKAGQYRHYAYDMTSEHRADRHELENFRGLVRCLGIEPQGMPRLKPAIMIAPPPKGLPARYIVFHPWASGFRHHFREWPEAHWIELARAVTKEGYAVVITGGPKDRVQSEALAATMACAPVIVAAGKVNLAETAAILNNAEAVVCVNTGIMHVAAALGCRMVALHGPTNPTRFGPLSANAVVLTPPREAGGGYLDLGFEYPRHPSDIMKLIGVAEAQKALEELMSRQQFVRRDRGRLG